MKKNWQESENVMCCEDKIFKSDNFAQIWHVIYEHKHNCTNLKHLLQFKKELWFSKLTIPSTTLPNTNFTITSSLFLSRHVNFVLLHLAYFSPQRYFSVAFNVLSDWSVNQLVQLNLSVSTMWHLRLPKEQFSLINNFWN